MGVEVVVARRKRSYRRGDLVFVVCPSKWLGPYVRVLQQNGTCPRDLTYNHGVQGLTMYTAASLLAYGLKVVKD